MSNFEVWRQDDNGNEFLVKRFETDTEAEGFVQELTRRGHKQLYWYVGQKNPNCKATQTNSTAHGGTLDTH